MLETTAPATESTATETAAQTAQATPAAPADPSLLATATQEAAQAAAAAEVVERPDYIPERFWRDGKPDVERLAKSYRDLEATFTKVHMDKLVELPHEKSTPEQIAAFRKAAGVPDSPEGYELKPEQLPEGVAFDEATAKRAAELAHKHNIPASAMKELMQFDLERAANMTQAAAAMMHERIEQGRAELQKTYGDAYDSKILLAKRAAMTAGVDPSSQGFTDPAVVKAFIALAEKLSDDKLVGGDSLGMSDTKSRAKDIMTNPANPLYSRYQSGDAEIVDRVRRMLSA